MPMASAASRIVEPEILDGLDANDPRALRSRRDLARINALMFNAAIAASLLRRHAPAPPRRILDLGAGDGRFMLAVARRLAARWPGVAVTLLDRRPSASRETLEAFADLGWHAEQISGDLFEFLAGEDRPSFDIMTANLVLHHFDAPQLRRLFELAHRRTALLVATEPRRDLVSLASSRMLWAIGANSITRHDAVASVRAGFTGKELSAAWRSAGGDPIEERRAGPFTHTFAGKGQPR